MRDDELTPAARTIGKRIISVDDESGDVRLGFVAADGFTNRHGTIGGGFLAAMLDSTAAAPLLKKLDDELSAVTTELHIRFERPAAPGELFGHGRIIERVERDAETEAVLSMPDGTVVATAKANFRIVHRREGRR
jgi:uncharacterized protein (TIGR00369 family)